MSKKAWTAAMTAAMLGLGLTGHAQVAAPSAAKPADSNEAAAVAAGKLYDGTMNMGGMQATPSEAQTTVVDGRGSQGTSTLNALVNAAGGPSAPAAQPSSARNLDAAVVPPPQVAASATPAPQRAGPRRNRRREAIYKRYGDIGAKIGGVAGGVGLGILGAAAGGPGVVGAVAGAILLGYVGKKAGGALGRAIGHGAAKARFALEDFAHNLKQFGGNLRSWFAVRPRWGQPYP